MSNTPTREQLLSLFQLLNMSFASQYKIREGIRIFKEEVCQEI
jgi:hypothetical protein